MKFLLALCLVSLVTATRLASNKILQVQKEIARQISTEDQYNTIAPRSHRKLIQVRNLFAENEPRLMELADVDGPESSYSEGGGSADVDGDGPESSYSEGGGSGYSEFAENQKCPIGSSERMWRLEQQTLASCAELCLQDSSCVAFSIDIGHDYDGVCMGCKSFVSQYHNGFTYYTIDSRPVQDIFLYENTAKDIEFAIFSVDDADVNFNDFSWSVNSESFYFNNAALVTNESFDYELQKFVLITVTVTDNDYIGNEASNAVSKQFRVAILDRNDVEPFSINLDPNELIEGSGDNAEIGTITFDDADTDAVNAFTISLVGPGANEFYISPSSPVDKTAILFAKHDMDYDAGSHNFNVIIVIGDGEHESQKPVVIKLLDLNDNPPENLQINDNPPSVTLMVDENSHTSIGTLTFDDEDSSAVNEIVIDLIDGTNAFKLSNTNLVYAQSPFDFDDETSNTQTFTIEVADGVHTTSAKFTVQVQDLNDNPVTAITVSGNNGVYEAQGAGVIVANLDLVDADSSEAQGQSFDISFDGSVSEFKIIESESHPRRFNIVTDQELNFEAMSSYTLSLIATDGQNEDFETTITIPVLDINDIEPSGLELDTYDVEETAPVGTLVSKVFFTDIDTVGTYNTTLISSDQGAFRLESFDTTEVDDTLRTTAQIVTNAVFAHHIKNEYTVEVAVSDGVHTVSESFTITIIDENDNPPTDLALDNLDIDEFTSAPINVGVVSFTDLDESDADNLTLNLDLDKCYCDGIFTLSSINSSSPHQYQAILSTEVVLDYEVRQTYPIYLEVSDGTSTLRRAFTLQVNDLNDNLPLISVVSRANCGALAVEETQRSTCNENMENDSCLVECAPGFSGSSQITTCQSDGTWSTYTVACAPDSETGGETESAW